MLPRVLVVAYYFPPAGGPGVQRTLKTVRYLRDAGFEPVVLTVQDGAFPSRDGSLAADVPDGVEVIRTRAPDPLALYGRLTGRGGVPTGAVEAGGALSRLALWVRANVFLPDARVGWVPFARWAGRQRLRQSARLADPFAAVVTSGPPHSVHLVGRSLQKTGVPWVADFRDPWTAINFYHDLPMSRAARALDRRLERAVLRRADAVTTVSPTWARLLEHQGGLAPRSVHVVHNGVDDADLDASLETEVDRGRFVLAHVGSLYATRDPLAVWDAVRTLREAGEVEKLVVRLVGRTDDAVRRSAQATGAPVEAVPYVTHADAVREQARAALLLLSVERFPADRGMITGKLYEYLASGRPVLGVGPVEGDASALLDETHGGTMYDRDDADGIAREIQRHYDAWAAGEPLAGAPWDAVAPYTRRAQTHVLADVIRSLDVRPPARTRRRPGPPAGARPGPPGIFGHVLGHDTRPRPPRPVRADARVRRGDAVVAGSALGRGARQRPRRPVPGGRLRRREHGHGRPGRRPACRWGRGGCAAGVRGVRAPGEPAGRAPGVAGPAAVRVGPAPAVVRAGLPERDRPLGPPLPRVRGLAVRLAAGVGGVRGGPARAVGVQGPAVAGRPTAAPGGDAAVVRRRGEAPVTGHVLHLATTHTPRDPRIVVKEAQTLAAAGLRVGVVTPADADGQFGEVETYAVPRPRGGVERMTRTAAAVVRRALALSGPETVLHLHDADLLAPGLAVAGRRRVVYDAHEDMPRQVLHQPWLPRPLRRPVGEAYRALEAAAGRRFAGVVAAEPAIYARYPPARTALVRNYPVVGELAAPDGRAWAEREPAAVYVGSITPARGLAQMQAAVARLDPALGAHLHLAGPFHPAGLADETRQSAGSRVTVHGRLGRPQVAALLARCRVGLSVLHPTPKYLEASPTKLFEYMAAGLPVVASDVPVVRDVVEPAGCGLLVDPLDVNAVAQAIGWLLEHPQEAAAMGVRGRAAVAAHYDWTDEGRRLVAFYRALLAGDPNPGAAAHLAVPC